MATSDNYLREVTRFLRDEYLVEGPIALQPGGKHRRLAFEYAGKAIKLTLQNTGHDRGSAVAFKQQDIRRLLGEPPIKPTTRKRRLDEMMPELSTLSAKQPTHADMIQEREPDRTYRGSIAVYVNPSTPDKTRMKINVPDDLHTAFAHSGALRVTRVDADTFQIEPHPDAGRKTPCFHRVGRSWEFSIEKLVPLEEGAYGSSSAEMVLVDGSIIARVLERKPIVRKSEAPVVQRSERVVSGSTAAVGTKSPSGVALFDPREVLAALRRVEAETPYRLVRVKDDGGGHWAFQAPRIE